MKLSWQPHPNGGYQISSDESRAPLAVLFQDREGTWVLYPWNWEYLGVLHIPLAAKDLVRAKEEAIMELSICLSRQATKQTNALLALFQEGLKEEAKEKKDE